MKAIIEIITKNLAYKKINPLGRWNIDHCEKRIARKIDLSNEDHCGPCGQYAVPIIPKIHMSHKNEIYTIHKPSNLK